MSRVLLVGSGLLALARWLLLWLVWLRPLRLLALVGGYGHATTRWFGLGDDGPFGVVGVDGGACEHLLESGSHGLLLYRVWM